MNNDLISRKGILKAFKKSPFFTEVSLYYARQLINNAPPIKTTIESLISTLSVEELKATTRFKVDTPSGEAISFRREKTGNWIDHSEDEGYVECPFCHELTNCNGNKEELHYCWHCGAKMTGGAE